MKVWRRGSLTTNPYRRTAFRVARVPRETVRHAAVIQLIGQTRRVVRADSRVHQIDGNPVTEAEINVAEQILTDPKQRMAEELLHHTAETLPLKNIKKLVREATELLSEKNSIPLNVTNLSGLQPWVENLVEQFLSGHPQANPFFGSLELEVPPPFGKSDE